MFDRPNEIAKTEDFEFAALKEAVNYRRALVREFVPHLNGRIIEIGAGIGQMTELLVKIPTVTFVQSIEADEKFCAEFRRIHLSRPLMQGTIRDVKEKTYDGIVSVNVLEHINSDLHELKLYHNLLVNTRGKLCLFIPARPELYSLIDRDFGHFRRYTKKGIISILESAGFEIEKIRYYNFAGYFAWLLTFRLLKNRGFNAKAVRFYDRFIFPVMNWLERHVCRPPFGQSLLVVAKAGPGR